MSSLRAHLRDHAATAARHSNHAPFLRTDGISDTTIGFLRPYLELEVFTVPAASDASKAVAGLCAWVKAVVLYHVPASHLVHALLLCDFMYYYLKFRLSKGLTEAMPLPELLEEP